MKNFSFFYARGGSGYIRGKQMADYLGGKHNPKNGFEDDLCIYVKIVPPDNYPKHTYCDVDDSGRQLEWLKTHTDTGVIAISQYARDNIMQILKRDDIYFIPHQHINFERWLRPETKEVKTVGIIGCATSFQYPIEDFRKEVEKLGLELRYEAEYWETYKSTEKQEMRLNILDFYKTMDIQVAFRPNHMVHNMLRNPNKLANAGACGIPTVAYAEPSYQREWGGSYLPVLTIDQMYWALRELKEIPAYYKYWAQKGWAKAEEYHIEKIAQLYRNLP